MTITATLTIDTHGIAEAAQRAGRSLAGMTGPIDALRAAISRSLDRLGQVSRDIVAEAWMTDDELWARYYVRGGMDPAYADVDALDEHVQLNLAAGRVDVAVAMIRGWVEHRDAQPLDEPLVWHRYLAGTRVEVVAA